MKVPRGSGRYPGVDIMPALVARSYRMLRLRRRKHFLAVRRRLWYGRSKGAMLRELKELGDLWVRLQLMWLQFDFVRGPVAVVCGRFGAGLGPKPTPIRPQPT